MTDFVIDTLVLHIQPAAGHEYRLEPIARRAAAILADRLRALPPGAASSAGPLHGAVPRIDFTTISDRQAAERIAGAWLGAIAPPARSTRGK